MSATATPSVIAGTTLVDRVRDRMLTQLLRAVATVGIPVLLVVLLFAPNRIENPFVFGFFGVLILLAALIAFLPRVPYALRAAIVLTLIFIAALLELLRGGLVGNGPLWLLGFVLFAILFAGARPGVLALLTTLPLIAVFGYAAGNDLLPDVGSGVDGIRDGSSWPAMLFVLAVVLAALVIGLNQLLKQLETAASDEASLAARLDEERMLLESRVANRTRALEARARLANRLARILDQQKLVTAVVKDVQAAFQYYHVQIYLLAADDTALNMVGGTGHAGQQMLARGHQIMLGRGLVGQAAATSQTILAPDVATTPGWLPNELLPDTQAEVAVPILVGRRVAGVLDVQQNGVGALGADDVALLETIAAQVGVALQNATLFANARRRAVLAALQVEAGQAIRRTRTVEDALRVSSQMLGDLLDAEQTAVVLTGSRPDSSQGSAA